MPTEVILPKVDMDMTVGTIAAWHVAEGAAVSQGEALFDIETDKATMEVESPATGTLHHVLAQAGTEVPIGAAVAWIYAEGEPVGDPPMAPAPAPKPEAGAAPAAVPQVAPTPVPGPQPASDPARDKPRATPAARRAARSHGISLADIAGTGLRGRIQRADVDAALQDWLSAAPAGSPAQAGPLHLARAGAGSGIPILFIHGFASDGKSWAAVEKHLPARHPRLRLDLPGHGGSPRRSAPDFAGLARDVRHAVDALPDAPMHIVAHSLGAAVALALADTRARRIASLTLIAPAGLGPAIAGDVIDGITSASRPESLEPWLRHLVADERLITANYTRAAWTARRDPDLRAAQRALARALFADGTQAFDLRAVLARLDLPLRVIWGREDRVIPWRHALSVPGQAALHLLPDTGHLPQLERPELTAMLISETLALAERRSEGTAPA